MRIVIPELNSSVVQEAVAGFSDIEFVSAESLDAAAGMVAEGAADAMVAGIDFPTRDVILACKKHLSMKSEFFSSCFICKREDRMFALADAGINKNPSSEQLFTIVEDTAKTFIKYTGERPRIAMLSYSTKGSGGKNAELEKIEFVIDRIREKHPDYIIDGEMQFDVAVNPAVAAKKMPDSLIKGDANILVVPDLNSGNILYKALEQFAGFTMAGPIVQGFEEPLADLSRGSTAEDIKLTIDVTQKMVRMKRL